MRPREGTSRTATATRARTRARSGGEEARAVAGEGREGRGARGEEKGVKRLNVNFGKIGMNRQTAMEAQRIGTLPDDELERTLSAYRGSVACSDQDKRTNMRSSSSRVDRYLPRSLIASLSTARDRSPLRRACVIRTVERLEGGCTLYRLGNGTLRCEPSEPCRASLNWAPSA